MFWCNTSIFPIKHGTDYALLLSRLKGKGKFTHLPKRFWAKSFGPGNTLEAKQRKDSLCLGLQPSINLIIANSWILSSNVRYAPKICSIKQSCVRHIHLKQWSRTMYWKNCSQIQLIMWSCPAPTCFFSTLSLYSFSLFSIYVVLILRKCGKIHCRFQVLQCETEIISHF